MAQQIMTMSTSTMMIIMIIMIIMMIMMVVVLVAEFAIGGVLLGAGVVRGPD